LCTELGGDKYAVAVGTDLAVPQDRDRMAARIDELGAADGKLPGVHTGQSGTGGIEWVERYRR
jgi:hypothetical protein